MRELPLSNVELCPCDNGQRAAIKGMCRPCYNNHYLRTSPKAKARRARFDKKRGWKR